MVMLFDLDGTLLDTAPEFTFCLNTLLAEENRALITLEALKPYVSFGTVGMLEKGFLCSRHDPAFSRLKARFLTLYTHCLGSYTIFFSGIEKILTTLHHTQIPFGIVTNKPTAFTLPLIAQFPLLRHAACVVAGDTLAQQKPDPAPLLYACQQLQCSPQDCWYIGDAKTDVEASHKAGMRCAVAQYGYIPNDENIALWGAEKMLKHAEEIAELMLGG